MEHVQIYRRISFSAGQRYYNSKLSDEENEKLFGELHSPSGFGHNYVLEVGLQGLIDPKSGMLMNLVDVDEILKKATQELDHRFLNKDVAAFSSTVPSAENVALYLRDKVARLLPRGVALCLTRLYEGPDFWVDVVEGTISAKA